MAVLGCLGRGRVTLLTALGAALASMTVLSPAATASTVGAGTRPSAVVVNAETYNLDLGADLTPLFGAQDIPSLTAAAAQVYADVQASLPAERMRAIAAIIARQRPDAVGLQEVATWALAPYVMDGPYPRVTGPYQTTYDFLALLLGDLARLKTPYVAVSTNTNFDSGVIPVAIPISATMAARYTDRNVILVSKAMLRHTSVTNPEQANYQAKFSVNLLGLTVPVNRGWASIDVTEHRQTFRFFDTHLEAYGLPPLKDQIRNPQAAELASLATASPYPVMLVGDINARPAMCATWRQPPDPQDANTVAYATLNAAGLSEVWPLVHPKAPCSPSSWTSGQDSLTGQVSTLSHRIDDIFLSASFTALQTAVVGDTAAERSRPHGLWPSDHASTVARVRLKAAH
ncbi:MAG: endonuclease/exonuclease/phosphatase family protein [Micromonosporaceae bacterium]